MSETRIPGGGPPEIRGFSRRKQDLFVRSRRSENKEMVGTFKITKACTCRWKE